MASTELLNIPCRKIVGTNEGTRFDTNVVMNRMNGTMVGDDSFTSVTNDDHQATTTSTMGSTVPGSGFNSSATQQQQQSSEEAIDVLTTPTSTGTTSTTLFTLQYSWYHVFIIFMVPALGGYLFGYDISSTSYTILQQRTTHPFVFESSILQGSIVATTAFGAFLGSYLLYQYEIPDKIGRRMELRYGSYCYIIGTILMILAGLMWPKSLPIQPHQQQEQESQQHVPNLYTSLIVLFLGRILYGFSIAFSMHGGPTYLSEMIPSSIRGTIISCKEAAIVLGIVTGYIIGSIFHSVPTNRNTHHTTGWIYTYGYTLIGSSAMCIFTYFIPRSYRWLLLTSDCCSSSNQQQTMERIRNHDINDDNNTQLNTIIEQEAYESLRFIYPKNSESDLRSVFQELKQQIHIQFMQQQQQSQLQSQQLQQQIAVMDQIDTPMEVLLIQSPVMVVNERQSDTKNILFQPQYHLQLVAGLGLVILQQITGQPSILSYVTMILQQQQQPSHSEDSTTTTTTTSLTDRVVVGISIFKFIMTLLAAGSVEYYGRKKLLYIGTSCMLVALITLTFTITNETITNNNLINNDDKVLLPYDGITDMMVATTVVSSLPRIITTIFNQHVVVVIALLFYIGGYQISFGPITWLLNSELFPLNVRGQATAVAVQLNFFGNTLVQFFIPILNQYFGYRSTFMIFTLFTLYSLYFIKVYVPETKGLSLEEIEEYFRSKYESSTNHRRTRDNDNRNHNTNRMVQAEESVPLLE